MSIFKHDPLGFLLRNRPKIEAIEGLKRVYLHETDEKYELMYREMRYGPQWEEHPEKEQMEGGGEEELKSEKKDKKKKKDKKAKKDKKDKKEKKDKSEKKRKKVEVVEEEPTLNARSQLTSV